MDMKQMAAVAALVTALGGCEAARNANPNASSGPPGAPEPTDPTQELVDLQGCRWWVVAKPGGMVWEKVPGFRADCDGEELQPANAAPRIEPVPDADAPDAGKKKAPEFTGGEVTINELEAVADLEEEEDAPAVAETAADGRGLYIQAATFRSDENARETIEELEGRGLKVLPIPDSEQGLQPIIVGPFMTKKERVEVLDNLRATGYPDAYLLLR